MPIYRGKQVESMRVACGLARDILLESAAQIKPGATTGEVDSFAAELMEKNIKPSDIITRDSMLNAIKMLYITGGSTNAIIHLLAISKTINLDISLNDFKKLDKLSVLLNMKPHGEHLMYDLYKYGGTSILIKYLIEHNILDGNILTITGNTLYENVKNFKNLNFRDQNIINSLDNPFKENSHIKILGGNLAPGHCISKVYDTNEKFRGKGYGEDIQKRLIAEAKTKNFSFVTVFVDPRNTASTIMHDKVGYKTIFRIHYSSDIIQDVKIIILKRKGVLVEGFLKLFNTKIGMFCLGCLLKVFRGFFKNIIGYNEQISPIPSLKHIIQNFEKI